ncbi:hypothetical protein ACFP9U_15330 [Nitratireductor sp. GCM10026969]
MALLGRAGCSTFRTVQPFARREIAPAPEGPAAQLGGEFAYYAAMYAARPEEKFPLPAVPFQRIDPVYYRRLVDDPTGERPGTIVVDTNNYFLYVTQVGGEAMRYGVGPAGLLREYAKECKAALAS